MTERLPMVHRRFRIDPRLHYQAIATARQRGDNLSEIIRTIITAYATDDGHLWTALCSKADTDGATITGALRAAIVKYVADNREESK